MSAKTLFLAWQDKRNQGWFPVGQLDVEGSDYRFRYIKGAERAREEVGFPLLMEFPDLQKKYESSELFPTFKNRIMSPSRPDFEEYMRNLGLSKEMDPILSLSVNGGYRATDSYEVFPKIEKRADGSFTCRFFLHGSRHTNQSAQEQIKRLKRGDNLYVTLELTNPATGRALQVQTTDYYMIGWTPRYLVKDLTAAMAESTEYSAKVVRINPQPAPSKQRVLIEMEGRWDGHEPMTSEDFKPLVD